MSVRTRLLVETDRLLELIPELEAHWRPVVDEELAWGERSPEEWELERPVAVANGWKQRGRFNVSFGSITSIRVNGQEFQTLGPLEYGAPPKLVWTSPDCEMFSRRVPAPVLAGRRGGKRRRST